MKSKTYAQNKQPSDKTQSSKFCQLGVKRTRFQNRKKKGNDFFDRSTTLNLTEDTNDYHYCQSKELITFYVSYIATKQIFKYKPFLDCR